MWEYYFWKVRIDGGDKMLMHEVGGMQIEHEIGHKGA